MDRYRASDQDQLSLILHQHDVFRQVFAGNESAVNRFNNDLKEQAPSEHPDMLYWMVRLLEGNRLIGCVKAREYQNESIELVFLLTEDERLKGYGFEMVSKVVEHLVSLVGVKKLWAWSRSDGSRQILSKLGFAQQQSPSLFYRLVPS